MNQPTAPTWQDKDQFEFAAKAAGYTKTAWVEDANGVERFQVYSDREMWLEWNPRDDDGDAFRLAVKLGFLVLVDRQQEVSRVKWCASGEVVQYWHWNHMQGADTSTRLAIFCAAAEVGKAMQ